MSGRPSRLEWISFLYLLFFVLAILSPSLYAHGYFGLSQVTLEELTIFAFGMAGIITFSIYERIMERRDEEQQQVEDSYQKIKNELIESYTYIGSVNRKIELLKKLADQTSLSLVHQKQFPKELFQALVANASASVGARAALLRFVDVEKLRTDREFLHHASGKGESFRVANKDLRALHERKESYAFVRSEDQEDVLVVPSDHVGTLKAYLLLRLDQRQISEVDTSLLKVFVNQAEMLFHQFSHPEKELLLLTGSSVASTEVVASSAKDTSSVG